MQKAPIPKNEKERMEALHRMAILDTRPEQRFDSLTIEAVQKLKVPISIISIIDSDREWFKSCQGLNQKEGKRDISFCGHALLAEDIFVVEDTLKDDRFKDNPMVTHEPFIRFYAGIALRDMVSGLPIGVFCIKDTKPRKLSLDEISVIIDIAERAELELNRG